MWPLEQLLQLGRAETNSCLAIQDSDGRRNRAIGPYEVLQTYGEAQIIRERITLSRNQ